MSTVKVKGLAELQKMLDQLPAKLEKNVLRSALRAGANVIAEAAREAVPVAAPSYGNRAMYGGYEGALRDSIRVSTRSRKGRVSATVRAGGGGKKLKTLVFYANWVEYGTAAHFIKPKKAKSLFVAGIFAKVIHHPGAKAKPFMRPAMDARAQDALVAVGEAIKARLTKRGLDTADIEISSEGN